MEGSGMKESEGDLLKCVVYESTLSTAARSPFPNGEGLRYEDTAFLDATPFPMGKAKRRRLRRPKKGSQPRLAALGSPFQGKGLAWTLPPSYGRRCPEGAEVGWGKRDEKERGRSSQVDDSRKHPLQKQLIKPIYSYKKRKSNAANDFNVIDCSGYRYMQEKTEVVHFYD